MQNKRVANGDQEAVAVTKFSHAFSSSECQEIKESQSINGNSRLYIRMRLKHNQTNADIDQRSKNISKYSLEKC